MFTPTTGTAASITGCERNILSLVTQSSCAHGSSTARARREGLHDPFLQMRGLRIQKLRNSLKAKLKDWLLRVYYSTLTPVLMFPLRYSWWHYFVIRGRQNSARLFIFHHVDKHIILSKRTGKSSTVKVGKPQGGTGHDLTARPADWEAQVLPGQGDRHQRGYHLSHAKHLTIGFRVCNV